MPGEEEEQREWALNGTFKLNRGVIVVNLESYGIDVGIIQGVQPEALRVRDCEFRSIEWTTEY
jgi:hypothetical protein